MAVQHFVRARQLEPGQLVFVTSDWAAALDHPELARRATHVTRSTWHGGARVQLVTFAGAEEHQLCLMGDTLVEVLAPEEQRPLGELQAMTADDLTCHALAYCATRTWDEYAALVVGLLAIELDEDEPDVADRIQTAADELVAA